MVEDLNINSFGQQRISKKKFNLIFQSGFQALIQRATRVTRRTATTNGNIITDAILVSTMNPGIIKANISNRFPIFTILENNFNKNKNYKKAKRYFMIYIMSLFQKKNLKLKISTAIIIGKIKS